jgi:site-specific recombinase XerD
MDYNRGRKLPGEVLTPEEVRAMMRVCNQGPTGRRNRALLAVLWRGGLRIGEALGLRPSDLEPRAGLVRVRGEVAKGGKPRAVGLDPEAFAVVEAWLAQRQAQGINGHLPVFCTLKGGALDAGYCRALIKRLARRAGITHRVHLHGLRHTHAVELVREGIPLPQVQAQLGHSSLSVTSRYLAHVTPEDLAAGARSRPAWSA